jgi:apoptosis-inducing factor 2
LSIRLLDRLILPYNRLLKRGRVVHDRAVAIEDGAVRLATNGSISGDIVVIATGSSYAHPFKASGDVSAFRSASLDAHEKLRAARSVAIVGAGAVGTELAGEIAAGMPAKKITLISPAPTLFPDFPPALGRRLQLDLQSMGVMLRLGAKAERLQGADRPFQGPVALAAGAAVAADLVFPTMMGASPVNELVRDLPGGELDPMGRVRLDPWLRPTGRTSTFALGDVAATADLMTIVAITRQAPWLAKSIKAAVAGQRVESLPRMSRGLHSRTSEYILCRIVGRWRE